MSQSQTRPTTSSSSTGASRSSKTTSGSSTNPYLDPSLLMFGNVNGGDDSFLEKHHYGALKSVDRDIRRNNESLDNFNPYLRGLTTSPLVDDLKQEPDDLGHRKELDSYLKKQKAKNDAYLQKLSSSLNKKQSNAQNGQKSHNSQNTQSNGAIQGSKSRNRNKFERTVVLEPLSSYQTKKLNKQKQSDNNSAATMSSSHQTSRTQVTSVPSVEEMEHQYGSLARQSQ